jgi:hypothetical protein
MSWAELLAENRVKAHTTSVAELNKLRQVVARDPVRGLVTYFDLCRRKRNMLEYDNASLTSEIEVQELLRKVKELEMIVENWIASNHPSLSPQS